MWTMVCAAVFLIAFLVSFLLVFVVRKLAFAIGALDHPSARKVHVEPTPLLGGLAIFGGFALTVGAGLLLVKSGLVPDFVLPYLEGVQRVGGKLSAVLAGGVLVVIFGVADDLLGLKPWQKLALQIFTGLIVFSVGVRISLLVENSVYSFAVTMLWLLAMMNSFNLLDNMDGLSSGVAFVSGAILFISALQMGQIFVATILAVFLGSTAGFLKHNFPPARIFMGECGSSFLGYFLGTVAILLTFYRYQENQNFLPIFTPLIVFAVPFFDTLSVIWIRRKRGLPIFKADKNHFSHRLVNLGLSQKQAILLIYALTLCTGMGALLLGRLNVVGGLLVMLQTVIIIAVVGALEAIGRKRNDAVDCGAG